MASNQPMRLARYRSPDSVKKIRIYVNIGKKGFNVGTSLMDMVRVPGVKAHTGLQDTFPTADEAVARFDALCADAVANGWILRTDITLRKSSFSAMPVASGYNPPQEDLPGEESEITEVADIKSGRRRK